MSKNRSMVSRIQRLGLCGGVAVAALLGLGSEASAQAADGKKVYGTVCAACHQADGSGVPGMYPPIAGSEWVTGDPGRLLRIIIGGVTGEIEVKGETYSSTMPPFGGAFKDPEIAALATYMRSNFGNKATPVTAAQVAEVRKATATRKTPWTAKELILSTAPKK